MIQNQVRAFLQLADAERYFASCRGSDRIIKRNTAKWDEIRERFITSIKQDITYSQESGLAQPNLNKEIVARGWFAMNESFLWTITQNDKRLT